MATWSRVALADAKADGLYLVKATVNGRWAKGPLLPQGSISASGVASESDALVLMAMIRHLTFPQHQPLPEPTREPTRLALAAFLRDLLSPTPEELPKLAALLTAPREEPPQPA